MNTEEEVCHECVHAKSFDACQRTQDIVRAIRVLLLKMPMPAMDDASSPVETARHMGQLNFLEDALVVAFTKNLPYIELKVPLLPCIAQVLLDEGFHIYDRFASSAYCMMVMPYIEYDVFLKAKGWSAS